ncbi:MAG TPA: hypothetical protein VMH50_16215 [Thermoleophilia bacterium]|nr:hypothetical protein [Thermoleophilia bacterium]
MTAPPGGPPPTPWQRKPVTGELIPCQGCGQGVADYRATCPFCGTPTGRPELPAPSAAPPRRRFSWRGLIVPVVLVLCVAGVAGVLALARSDSKPSADALSPQAAAFLGKAMPTLDRVMAEAQAGNDTQAAADWNSIGEMPTLLPADISVSQKYTAYADTVRGYLIQDGSTTPQQVQAAKATVEKAVAATKSP